MDWKTELFADLCRLRKNCKQVQIKFFKKPYLEKKNNYDSAFFILIEFLVHNHFWNNLKNVSGSRENFSAIQNWNVKQ